MIMVECTKENGNQIKDKGRVMSGFKITIFIKENM